MELEKVKLEILRVLSAQGPAVEVMELLQIVVNNLNLSDTDPFYKAMVQLANEGLVSHVLKLKITPGQKISDSLH